MEGWRYNFFVVKIWVVIELHKYALVLHSGLNLKDQILLKM